MPDSAGTPPAAEPRPVPVTGVPTATPARKKTPGTSATAASSATGARPATIRDVAAAAGVSIGTASKALTGQGRLRPETRHRVTEAADRLGFAPNVLAQ